MIDYMAHITNYSVLWLYKPIVTTIKNILNGCSNITMLLVFMFFIFLYQRWPYRGILLTGRGWAQETLPDEVASHGGGRGTATAGASWEPCGREWQWYTGSGDVYPLVMTNIAMENPNHKWRFLAGKIIYKWAIFHGYVK
jgi:hypothetical protein